MNEEDALQYVLNESYHENFNDLDDDYDDQDESQKGAVQSKDGVRDDNESYDYYENDESDSISAPVSQIFKKKWTRPCGINTMEMTAKNVEAIILEDVMLLLITVKMHGCSSCCMALML